MQSSQGSPGVASDLPDVVVAPEVRAISQELLPEVEQLGRHLATRIRDDIPLYADERTIAFETVVASTTANLRHVLGRLAGMPPTDGDAARLTGEDRAVSGVPYDAVLQAYRIGGRFIWELLVSRAPVEAQEVLLRAAADIWAVTDELQEQVTEGYRSALETEVRRDGQRRAVLVGAVLGGDVGESDELWRSAGVLGMGRHGVFVVVSAECPAAGAEALRDVEAVLRRKNLTSAWCLASDFQDGLVQLRPEVGVDALVELLRELAPGRVGVSATFDRLTSAPDALREARTACIAGTPRSAGVVRFDAQPLPVLLATAPLQSEALARSVLGKVLDLPEEDRRMLIQTARVWLACAGSTSTAAKELHLHRNTVRYRLRRVEQLTGRDLAHPASTAEVYVALECARILDLG